VKVAFLEERITYTGAQLRSGWVAEATGLSGEAAVCFLGPCEVAREHMVDLEDLEAGARISSPKMLHLIAEHPGLDLSHITTRQRLLMALAGELLNAHLGENLIRREGDDLYFRNLKLSISVATVSPASGLIHSAFNVLGEGAPVPAIGLEELGVKPREFGEALLAAYAREVEGMSHAASRVKRVQ